MEQKYTIVFSGKTIQGKNIETVKSKLASFYGNDEKKIEILFSGNPIVIKKNIDKQTVLKYKNIFEECGAILNVMPIEEIGKPSSPSPSSLEIVRDQSHSQTIKCPSCDFKQPQTDECVKCGIIIDKFHYKNSTMIKERVYSQKPYRH